VAGQGWTEADSVEGAGASGGAQARAPGAAPAWSAAAESLRSRLAESPYSFDFFMAVRRMECAMSQLPRMGHSKRPREDPVRFCQEPSLAFPPSTLHAYRPGGAGGADLLFVNFLGLLGPNGPMPLHLTEYIRDRQINSKDITVARFLDVFNHRMVALFYRAWACNQQTVNYERGSGDRFSLYIGSLFGIGMDSLRGRDAVPDVAKLHYSGRLVCQTRHAEGLRAVLEDYFRVPVAIEEFVGQWLELPPDCCCRLGEAPSTGLLGRTTIVGARIWECQQRFRLKFGPMGLAAYQRMLPGGGSLLRLIAWVRNYIYDELEWDVQLILKKEEVPKLHLGKLGQLGWTTWLSSKPFTRDADDLVLRPLGSR